MTTQTPDIDSLSPDQAKIQAAEKLCQALERQLAQGESPQMILSGDQPVTRTELPETVARLLVKILSEIAKGNAVSVVSLKPELTTQETADLLNLPQPYLLKLLEQDEVPSHVVGTDRRILLADALAYKRKSFEKREAILKEMMELNQEMGLYD
jgi:excisionase family DNA binding protein